MQKFDLVLQINCTLLFYLCDKFAIFIYLLYIITYKFDFFSFI